MENMSIVCYTGGTCGDLISAMVDTHNALLNSTLGTVTHCAERTVLKKPQLLTTIEKEEYLHDISGKYLSISSHDLTFHLDHRHDFISITVVDPKIAIWAASRFERCHRAHVWEEMKKACNAATTEDYAKVLIDYSGMVRNHTDKIIKLEDIVNGNAVESLENILKRQVSSDANLFYKQWLETQHFAKS